MTNASGQLSVVTGHPPIVILSVLAKDLVWWCVLREKTHHVPRTTHHLVIGHWDFVGHWGLVIGHSPPDLDLIQ
jgi:hypothetical protein